MNKDLKLNIKLPKLDLPFLQRALPIVVGVALAVAFTLTALSIKKAVTVQDSATATTSQTVPSFNESTIQTIKGLLVIPDAPNISNLGKSDPFN